MKSNEKKKIPTLSEKFQIQLQNRRNKRNNRRGNHEWTIQRHWQHCVHKTQDKDKQNNTEN